MKYLSRTMRVPITFCMASQCRVLSAAFLRLVMTGIPCLKLVTFCFSLGTTLLGGRPRGVGQYYFLVLPKITIVSMISRSPHKWVP